MGFAVTLSALCAVAVRFSKEHKFEERRLYEEALAARAAESESAAIAQAARS